MIWVFLLSSMFTTPQEVWTQANRAYQEGRFPEAVKLYEALVEEGVKNGKLHFNLGNAYYKTGQLGKAILHYSRARRYLPGDEDIATNLAIANQNRVDPQIDEENEAVMRSLDRLAHSINYILVFYLALGLLCLGGLSSVVLIMRPHARKWVGYLMVIGVVIGIFFMGLAFLQHKHLTRDDMAVVIAREVDVLSGPSTTESVSFTIHEGIGCRILDKTEGWVRIRLANGYNGWVRRGDIAVI